MIFRDGSKYEGEWSEDKKHGYGILEKGENYKFIGYFIDDIRVGEGTEYYKNGNTYTGEFKNGKRDGEGTLIYNKEGYSYTG